jgi:predicted nucleic acid-binding protein
VITIGELRAGVLAATDLTTRDRRLRTLTAALELDPVPIDTSVAEHWAKLRVALRDSGLRMGVNDSWIAATALALDVPVLTQDEGFPLLEELRVLRA